MEPSEDPIMVAKLRSFLSRNTRIEITDGRLFVGQFMCIDHSKNIILAGAYESRPEKPSSSSEKRFVGLVMIPGHHIVKAEMDASHLRGVDARIKATTKYDLDYLRG
ncbi:hypothetical protein BGZ83_001434 [Gryganskiella cystojenkinii]|nr:hypothetical protein BGZ83_001434 [Gryganskiella cystojenkinii]